MKQLKSLFKNRWFLFLLFASVIGWTFTSSLADRFIYIGETRIWDDIDSARLKFSKKISRDYYGQALFDTRTGQFGWGTDGLYLAHPLGDSVYGTSFTVKKDSMYAENQWFKRWSLWRPYFNYLDSISLVMRYYNYDISSTVPQAKFWLLNKVVVIADRIEDLDVNTSWTDLYIYTYPYFGTWLTTVELEYEFNFDASTAADCKDSLTARVLEIPDVFYSENNTVKCAYPNGIYGGMRGRMTFQFVKYESDTHTNHKVQAIASQDALVSLTPIGSRITGIRITAQIIN